MAYSIFWFVSLVAAILAYMYVHFVVSEREKNRLKRPRLPTDLLDEKSLEFTKFPKSFFWGAATAAHQVSSSPAFCLSDQLGD
jgi:hypothetical protein